MKITIKDISEKAGVSISTVSNALNQKGKVSPETMGKILNLAKEMGYFEQIKPEKNLSKTNKKIGVIFPRHSPVHDPNYYISEVLAGVEERIRDAGFSLLIETNQGEEGNPSLLVHKPDGLLLIGGQFPEEYILRMHRTGIPIVTIGTYVMDARVNSVVADNHMGAFQATTYLLNQGHRKIGLMNGPDTTNSSRSKYEGFREALLRYDLRPDESWMTSCDFSVDQGYEQAKHLLRQKRRPSAMFVSDDPIAIGAMKAIQEEGLRIPEDMAIIGFGNSPTGKYLSPALSTVDVFQRKLGFHGADRLQKLINQTEESEKAGNFRLVYETELIIRESC